MRGPRARALVAARRRSVNAPSLLDPARSYVVLYLDPALLHSEVSSPRRARALSCRLRAREASLPPAAQMATMREIVDKHFNDNWVRR